MITETEVHAEKRIEELTDHDIGWIYSLSKWGKWEDSKIARQFKISDSDAREVINNCSDPWGKER
jgi:hypothetical protein